jgi:hypothetical protein
MIFSKIGYIPTHQYVYIDSTYTHKEPCGFVEAMWTGITSIPGRTWGINVILRDGGAMYRNIPPHAVAFSSEVPLWSIGDAQLWDCYSYDFTAIASPHLRGMRMQAKVNDVIYRGEYLFNVTHINDGWSDTPEQDKDFYFIKLDNGRLTIQPTNRIAFMDSSFIVNDNLPRLKLHNQVYSCE